jgi:hypothetical protein
MRAVATRFDETGGNVLATTTGRWARLHTLACSNWPAQTVADVIESPASG